MSETVVPPDEVYRLIGSRIRDVREKRGLSQERLARHVDLTRTSITNIEKGRQKLLVHTLVLLSDALGVSVVDLITAPQKEDPVKAAERAMQSTLSQDQRNWVIAGVIDAMKTPK